MPENLQHFLQNLEPLSIEVAHWGTMELQLTHYLSKELPPRHLITSARAVVLQSDRVLVVRDKADSVHILPGGRCEPGEELLETVRREVLEESGWSLTNIELLGFRHFHHVTPEPPDYAYPYPDFCQAIYAACAEHFFPAAREFDQYVLETFFCPIAEAKTLKLSPAEQQYLMQAHNLLNT